MARTKSVQLRYAPDAGFELAGVGDALPVGATWEDLQPSIPNARKRGRGLIGNPDRVGPLGDWTITFQYCVDPEMPLSELEASAPSTISAGQARASLKGAALMPDNTLCDGSVSLPADELSPEDVPEGVVPVPEGMQPGTPEHDQWLRENGFLESQQSETSSKAEFQEKTVPGRTEQEENTSVPQEHRGKTSREIPISDVPSSGELRTRREVAAGDVIQSGGTVPKPADERWREHWEAEADLRQREREMVESGEFETIGTTGTDAKSGQAGSESSGDGLPPWALAVAAFLLVRGFG